MASNQPIIRPIRRDQGEAWSALRLEALTNHPTAFASNPQAFLALTPEQRLSRIPEPGGPDALFGAYLDGSLHGCAGFIVEAGLKERHKGLMWGVYLRPVLRGTGASEALVQAVIDQARAHVDILRTSVTSENLGARALYLRLGFQVYGVEPRALRIDGQDYDEDLLAMVLR